MFKTWARYLNAFNKKYPDDKTDMIKSLLLYYTDDTLSQVLITAKQVPSTEKMATNLQLSLLNKWARDKNPPAEVSKLLNVGSSDTLMKTYAKKYDWALKNVVDDNIEVLENLTKETWLKYLGDFDKKKRDASSTIAELTARYGDESLARMIEESKDNAGLLERAVHVLQTSQIKGWMDSKNSVDDVFNLLKLNDKGNMRLDNPLLKRTLQLFIIRFNKENPSAQTSIIETLRRNYGDEILSKILISGKGVRKTQATASSWQTKLLDKWLEAGTQPSVVFKWLQLKSSALDNTERQVYETYAMKFKTKYPAGRLE
uniref:RxLR effector protein n=2 Tax=Phytophthora ramorum TaxID=164328 RepID=H3GF89_PHYRM